MKKIISITILLLTLPIAQIVGQLESIKEFPKQYESQEIKELTPIWISENEILVFYKNSTLDTIFSRRTTNLGQTWGNQKFEQVVESPDATISGMCLFKTSSGRLLFFWASTGEAINCSYSDDNGNSWINAQQIPGLFLFDFSVTEIEQGKIILSFSNTKWRTRIKAPSEF